MTTTLGDLLIVDDEEANRDMLSRRLEAEGYSAVLASSGDEALWLIAQREFDAVLLDITMPHKNGYDVLREIRASRSILDLPVLMVTASSHGEDMVNAFEYGANDYITKPINFQVALARINCAVSGKRINSDAKRNRVADALTGLANRTQFMDRLNVEIEAAKLDKQRTFAVLFIDLDHFKPVNDNLGHQSGDTLLVTVAKRLETSVRSSDVVYRVGETSTVSRFGGDEFVILLNGIKNSKDACGVADRIQNAIKEPITLSGVNVSVSASIGIAMGGHETNCASDILADADTAMYHAKDGGKARWALFNVEMRDQAAKRIAFQNEQLSTTNLHSTVNPSLYWPVEAL